jgi:hypothetical protein
MVTNPGDGLAAGVTLCDGALINIAFLPPLIVITSLLACAQAAELISSMPE